MPNNNPAALARAMAEKVVENIYNLAYVTRAFQDGSIPCSKLVGGGCGGSSLPYTEYVALVTQTGTAAPTAVILQNDLGFTPTFAYISTGRYTLTAPGGGFGDDKLYFDITKNLIIGEAYIRQTGDDVLTIWTYNNSNVLEDDWLVDTPLLIRVYP